MRVFNPFGPKIAITKIPKKIINKINKEVAVSYTHLRAHETG